MKAICTIVYIFRCSVRFCILNYNRRRLGADASKYTDPILCSWLKMFGARKTPVRTDTGDTTVPVSGKIETKVEHLK